MTQVHRSKLHKTILFTTYWGLGFGRLEGTVVGDQEFHVVDGEGAGELLGRLDGRLGLEDELEVADVVAGRPHPGWQVNSIISDRKIAPISAPKLAQSAI